MPITVKMWRQATGDEGTFGQLQLPSGWSCFTGELPWRDNTPGLSCIPAGTYRGVVRPSTKFKANLIELQGVLCRDHILIHRGNWCGDITKGLRSDVEGCILLGERIGQLDGQKALLGSFPAVDEFYHRIGMDEILLTIAEAWSDKGGQ